MLVHFPMALWMPVFPCEFLAWAGRWELFRQFAFWANAAALAAAVPAALTGLLDLAGLKTTRAAALGNRHMVIMLLAAAFFGADFFLALGTQREAGFPVFLNLGLSFGGMILLAYGGWLGGELVFRHGAGQKNDATHATPQVPEDSSSRAATG
jgi:uncharacterized membrane protein